MVLNKIKNFWVSNTTPKGLLLIGNNPRPIACGAVNAALSMAGFTVAGMFGLIIITRQGPNCQNESSSATGDFTLSTAVPTGEISIPCTLRTFHFTSSFE